MIDRAEYLILCRSRWDGWCLRDARSNFPDFEDINAELTSALRDYHRDPCLEDVNGKYHNPDGTLSAMLWNLQNNLQSDKSCLHPLLDFNESSQTIFLRRGLIFYCTLILRNMEAEMKEDAAQLVIPEIP